MNTFEVKANNKKRLYESIFSYNKSLVKDMDYHFKKVNSIKEVKYKNAKTYDQVTEFVDKNFSSNKHKLAADKCIEEARKEILAMSDAVSSKQIEKIDAELDGKINLLSDSFETNLKKALRGQIEERDVFEQLVYNLTMGKIEQDFMKLGLPSDKYTLKIKDDTLKNKKDKVKSV